MAGNSLKAAPRREVTRIERIGDWGEVEYHHVLSCGHVEIRKRNSPATHLACSGCLTAARFVAEGPAAGRPQRTTPIIPPAEDGIIFDDLAGIEAEIAQIRAGLAKAMGVSTEAVDVAVTSQTGVPQVAYALVFIDPDNARRLARLDNGSQEL